MLQRYGLSQWIEKPLHAFENSMDVHRMQRLSNWLFAWWHGVLCLRAAVLSSLPLNGEGLPAPINKRARGIPRSPLDSIFFLRKSSEDHKKEFQIAQFLAMLLALPTLLRNHLVDPMEHVR